jgi:3',5'-cyclic AMP phosphodiesterase CpdA
MNRFLCGLAIVLGLLAADARTGSGSDALATRIAFLSDTHVNLRTNEAGQAYNKRLDRAIAEVNAAHVDLVLIAGDLTDGGTREQMELFKRKAKQLKAPVLLVPGNHDVGIVGNGTVKTSITPEKVRLYGKVIGPNWFVSEKSGLRVVGIDSCLFGSGFKEEAEQWKFLEKALAKPHAKPTLLLEHYPLFVKSVDEPRVSTWNVQPEPRQRLLALVEQGGVRAVLSGHLHYPIINRLKGILFLGNTTTAFGLPRGVQPEGWMLLSVPREGEIQFELRKLE